MIVMRIKISSRLKRNQRRLETVMGKGRRQDQRGYVFGAPGFGERGDALRPIHTDSGPIASNSSNTAKTRAMRRRGKSCGRSLGRL